MGKTHRVYIKIHVYFSQHSRVFFEGFTIVVDVYNPWPAPSEVKHEYGIEIITEYPEGIALNPIKVGYVAIILAVARNKFMQIDLQKHKNLGCIIYDVKRIFSKG